MPVSSDAVASSLITAVQRDLGVWVRRTVSAIAWSRCHLLCHWLQDHPFKWTTVGPGETEFGLAVGAMTGKSGAVTTICERALPLPVKVRPPRWRGCGTPRCGSTVLRPALTGHGRRIPAGFGPRGRHHLAGCAFRFAGWRHDAGKPVSGAKRTPRFAADLLKGKRDSL